MLSLVACGKEEVVVEPTTTEVAETVEAATETTEVAEVAEVVGAAPELENKTLLLATTTSTNDSGLLEFILGDFTAKTGVEVKVVAVGTGKALQMGRDGEADILLVHAKADEEVLVEEGFGTERHDVMYNDFIIVGPSSDPVKLKETTNSDIILGLKAIYDGKGTFVSRGDDSGTHKMELKLWEKAGITLGDEDFYLSTGKGMGDVLTMASEVQGYTLTDRATYLSMRDNLDLDILLENDPQLFNQYGVIPVNPELNDMINGPAATLFMEWLLSDETQALIGTFGVEKFGMPLFIPNAEK
jgi:tungstate transport system substrate-binding protein